MNTTPSGYPSPDWQPPGWQPPPSPRKSWPARHKVWTTVFAVVGVFVVLGVIGAVVGSPKSTGSSTNNAAVSTTAPAVSATSAAPTPAAPTQPTYTAAQQQALASAESYLSLGQGFSKRGLFQQLHSKSGEGFSKSLARFAVNHVKVNWRHQAVLSARAYMQTQPGWSYAGLVDQLDSAYGEGFTRAQAEYAAHAVGL
jgi:hypothetical protein